jgi:hypothetical protein
MLRDVYRGEFALFARQYAVLMLCSHMAMAVIENLH